MQFLDLFLDKKDSKPLYSQLYTHLAEGIRCGEITAGERLPGKRTAAAQLGVSVNTVDEAYQMLAAEGYVEARPRSGFVVCRLQQQLVPPPRIETHARTEPQARDWQYSFSSGDIDTSLFPRKMWNRIFRDVLFGEPALFGRGEAMGDRELREAIAQYLRGYRGVRCDASQIVVGAGLEVLTGRLVRLFPDYTVAMENPGYPKAAHVMRNVGVQVCPVEVDKEGMRPDLLEESGAQAAYLTPSHQFPTGGVMPAGRRSALLRWATAKQRLIIEDDYDSEFRFDGRPLPCLQGLDEAGHVVYAGTFSRSLAPGIRAAYLVLPPALLEQWQTLYGDYACTISRPEQHTLARFMAEGHFSRNLNRTRAAYKRRRSLVLEAIKKYLAPGSYTIENEHTGLYFILRLQDKQAKKIAEQARQKNIRIQALANYRFPQTEGSETDALIIGYGGLAERQIEEAVKALAWEVDPAHCLC